MTCFRERGTRFLYFSFPGTEEDLEKALTAVEDFSTLSCPKVLSIPVAFSVAGGMTIPLCRNLRTIRKVFR